MADVQQLRASGSVDELVALLDAPQQWEAVQALAAIGAPAVPRLLDEMLSGRSDNACWRAAQALSSIDPKAVPAAPLLQGLASESASVRRWSAWVVQKVGPFVGDPALRSRMAEALLALLGDATPAVRQYAADALPGVVAASDRERLVRELRHEDRLVRAGVAAAIGRVGTVPEVGPLLDALRDSDVAVRMRAAEALGRVGAGVAEAAPRSAVVAGLAAALKDKQFGVRLSAAESLGMLGDPGAEPSLRPLLDDPDAPVRESASKALRRLQKPQRG
jgi:hypothetical protein